MVLFGFGGGWGERRRLLVRTLGLEGVLALDLGKGHLSAARLRRLGCCGTATYGTAGNAIEALLALDGDVGAVGSLELDVEGSCITPVSSHAPVQSLARATVPWLVW